MQTSSVQAQRFPDAQEMIVGSRVRDIGAAYSLSTLWFIVPIKELVYPGTNYYLLAEPHSIFEYLAVFTDVLVLSIGFFALITLMRTVKKPGAATAFQLLFVTLGVLTFGPLSYESMKWLWPSLDVLVSFPVPIAVLLICVLLAKRGGMRLKGTADNVKLIALFFLPFSFLVLVQSLRAEFIVDEKLLYPVQIESGSSAPHVSSANKVVWIIFDELDYAALSTASQNHTHLEDINRLKNESLVAHGAYSPNQNTMEAIPALLTGRRLKQAIASSARDLALYPEDGGEPINLRTSGNVFTDARSLGAKTALVGWYHPYSRLFEGDVDYCYWSAQAVPRCNGVVEFAGCETRVFLYSLEKIPFARRFLPEALWTAENRLKDEDVRTQRSRHDFLLSKSIDLLTNSDSDLFFMHFSIPHYPAIGLAPAAGEGTYFTSLQVVDKTVGEIRSALERSGKWQDTILIISSDHPWRVKAESDFEYLPVWQREKMVRDRRVPFIVRFPGQTVRVDVDSRFNTIVSRLLLHDIFAGKVRDQHELKEWLAQVPAEPEED